MDTPNKIYIAVYPNDDGLDTHLGDWYSEPEYRAEDNIEYIRKDTLLEWLKGYNHPITQIVIQEIIDKINSM